MSKIIPKYLPCRKQQTKEAEHHTVQYFDRPFCGVYRILNYYGQFIEI